MPLESTVICLDNSEWMRNGDYVPTRFASQQDAASMLCNARLMDNPESTVGMLTMAGAGVDLLASPTEELSKILAAMSKVKMSGKADLTTSIQIAQLSLNHRKNKNGGQRIIVFLGSPVTESTEALQKIGKLLKKNNVALDVISMGESDTNEPKLQELVNAANTGDNSHLVIVPPGVSPINVMQSSPLFEGSVAQGNMGGGDDLDMYGGIDPALDPELAMAIRISQEEARAHEEARAKSAAASSEPQGETTSNSAAGFDFEEDEAALIQQALELSMRDIGGGAPTAPTASSSSAPAPNEAMEEEDEDEELQRALALSMAGSDSSAAQFSDPNFVNQLMGDMDPDVQAALEQIRKQDEEKAEKDKEDKNKKRKSDDV